MSDKLYFDLESKINELFNIIKFPELKRSFMLIKLRDISKEEKIKYFQKIYKQLDKIAEEETKYIEGFEEEKGFEEDEGFEEEKEEYIPVFTLNIPIYDNNNNYVNDLIISNLNSSRYRFLQYCYEQCNVLSRFPLESKPIDGRAPLLVLTNEAQAWKTRVFLLYAMICLEFKKNVIIMVQNDIGQKEQLLDSIYETRNELIKIGQERGFNPPFINPLYAGDNIRNIQEFMRLGGALVLAIDNQSQLGRISNFIKDEENLPEHIVIYDESDFTIKQDNRNLSSRDRIRLELIRLASLVIGVTATPVAHFLGEGELTTKLHFVKALLPEDYCGFGNEKCQVLEICRAQEYSPYEILNVDFTPPVWFNKALAHFLSLPPRTNNEPHNLLIKITNLNRNHRIIRDYLKHIYPEYPSLINNSDDVELYFPQYEGRLKKWNFGTYVKVGKIHKWTTAQYSHIKSKILELYNEIGCIDKPFFEIAGLRSGRGLRHKTKEHTWLISAELYMDKIDIDYATAYQAVARSYGKRGNDLDVKWLYTTKEIHDTLRDGFNNYKRYVYSECENDLNMKEVLKQTPITRGGSMIRMCKNFDRNFQKKRIVVEQTQKFIVTRSVLKGSKIKIYDQIIDYLGNHDSFVKRSEIIKYLVETHGYSKFPIAGRITEIVKLGFYTNQEISGILIIKKENQYYFKKYN